MSGPPPTENPMRTLQDHKINPVNDTLEIAVLDEAGHGGASHAYLAYGFKRTEADDEAIAVAVNTIFTGVEDSISGAVIVFQNGPIGEVGVNGITHEVLLAILVDRLVGFQCGPYACEANARALALIGEAQRVLKERTTERMNRGVEGTHAV